MPKVVARLACHIVFEMNKNIRIPLFKIENRILIAIKENICDYFPRE